MFRFTKLVFLLIALNSLAHFNSRGVMAVDVSTTNWAKQLGGGFSDTGRSVTTNSSGEVIVVGEYFSDNFDADGDGNSEYTTPGFQSGFISVFNSSGVVQWTKAITGAASSQVNVKDVVTDSSGGIYIVGSYTGTVDFDPGAGTENHVSTNSNADIYILKLDSTGNFQWVKTVGSTGADFAYSVTINSSRVFVGGRFVGTVDFDDSASTSNKTAAGSNDAFLWAMDLNGTYEWTEVVGGTGGDTALNIDLYGSTVYMAGFFNGTVDMDPGAGTENATSAGSSDAFLISFTTDGSYNNHHTWGGTEFDGADYVRVTDDGTVYVTGYFADTVDFDPGAGTNSLAAVGGDDFFITQFDSNLSYQWTKAFGGNDYDYVYGLTTDSENNAYINGSFLETLDFDPGAGTQEETAAGSDDIFLLQLNEDGTYGDHRVWGDVDTDYGFGLTINGDVLYLTGGFSGDVQFGSQLGQFTSYGSVDAFLLSIDVISNNEETTSPPTQQSQANSTNSSGPKLCDASVPIGTIDLFQINRKGSAATLFFTPLNDHVKEYHVVFGFKAGDERFGGLSLLATESSNKGVQQITVSDLDPTASYWFSVIPINGCASGQLSNWLKAGVAKNKEVLYYR